MNRRSCHNLRCLLRRRTNGIAVRSRHPANTEQGGTVRLGLGKPGYQRLSSTYIELELAVNTRVALLTHQSAQHWVDQRVSAVLNDRPITAPRAFAAVSHTKCLCLF